MTVSHLIEPLEPLCSLHDLFRNGLLRAIARRHIPVATSGNTVVVNSVTLGQVTPILVVVAAGVFIATVLVVAENVYRNFHGARRKDFLKLYWKYRLNFVSILLPCVPPGIFLKRGTYNITRDLGSKCLEHVCTYRHTAVRLYIET